MNDNKSFDSFITEVMSEDNRIKTVITVNPWDTCIKCISTGFLMIMFQLNFLGLNYILPLIGSVILYCGIRTLKHENRFFFVSSILSLIYTLFIGIITIINATPLAESKICSIPIGSIVLVILLFSLHLAFNEVFANAEKKQRNRPFLLAAVWEVFVVIVCFIEIAELSFLVGTLFLVSIVLIVRAMYKLKDLLPNIGYELNLFKPLISNKTTVIAYLCIVVSLTVVMNLHYNHTLSQINSFHIDKTSQQRQYLLDIGFPKEIIDDVTDADVKLLSNCNSVLVFGEGYGKFENTEEETTEKSDVTFLEDEGAYEPDKKITFYRVHLQTKDKIYVLEYFDLKKMKPRRNVRFINWFGTDYNEYVTPLSGKLIFEKDGETKISDIVDYRNLDGDINNGAIIQGRQELTGIICYPFGVQNERGYILYESDKNEEPIFNPCFNYNATLIKINYPYSSKPNLTNDGIFDEVIQDYALLWGFDWSGNRVDAD